MILPYRIVAFVLMYVYYHRFVSNTPLPCTSCTRTRGYLRVDDGDGGDGDGDTQGDGASDEDGDGDGDGGDGDSDAQAVVDESAAATLWGGLASVEPQGLRRVLCLVLPTFDQITHNLLIRSTHNLPITSEQSYPDVSCCHNLTPPLGTAGWVNVGLRSVELRHHNHRSRFLRIIWVIWVFRKAVVCLVFTQMSNIYNFLL